MIGTSISSQFKILKRKIIINVFEEILQSFSQSRT